MWKPELTDEVVFLAKLQLAQAGIQDCDCDVPCSCLEIQEFGMDVDETVIKTKNRTYILCAKKAGD